MADKDELNDEYQFADLDAMAPDSSEDTQDDSEKRKPLEQEEADISRQNMKRNGAIAVVGLIVIILLYKLFFLMFLLCRLKGFYLKIQLQSMFYF